MVPEEAAGMRSGAAWASAPSSVSVMRWDVSTLPAAIAAWQLADGGAHHALAVVLQLAHVPADRRRAVLGGDLAQTALTAGVGHQLRSQIALAFFRSAHVGHDHAQQVAVDPPAARQKD